jgi:ribosomal protein S6E (S10)
MANKETKTVVVSEGAKSTMYKISKINFKKLLGLKINSTFNLKDIEIDSEHLVKITGASTSTGTPIYSAIKEPIYKKVSYKQNTKKGIQRKLRVYGNLITEQISAIDVVAVTHELQ